MRSGNKMKSCTRPQGLIYRYRFLPCGHVFIYSDTSATIGVLLMLRVPQFHYTVNMGLSGVTAGFMEA
jgi:hypothetical protein